ncbi:uncharacterized protein LOC128556274 [Mercenaria mercenaria]|uniref:uncharacterized protein LOC128556274 n=1 Tax=Mercenaria mercenaria TaxID=6596 RepID=UPI00234F81E4|nr:uncharacterized protein LOC128556274 [Mercenaria mercenaria]
MSKMSSTTSLIRYDDELKRRLEKLSRTYDLTTMKIFIAVECLGEELVTCTYNAGRKSRWETFLQRKEACRLDLHKHEKNRSRYREFLKNVSREHQGQQFYTAMLQLMKHKGAEDMFKQITQKSTEASEQSFCGNLCRLFERKIESWWEIFEAVGVKLTGHVKVSNFVRVLAGQVDALCCKDGKTYAINIKVTGLDTPRPLDIAELAMCKILIIQNGLADPAKLKMCLLILHLTEERPILRLWEYIPTEEMERSIREADIDKVIDAGKLSQYHEFWKDNVHQIGNIGGDQIL